MNNRKKTQCASNLIYNLGDVSASILLIDVSNTFTKLALAKQGKIARVTRIPTADLSKTPIPKSGFSLAIISSVVPKADALLRKKINGPLIWVDHKVDSGVTINYPNPASIGADRLANAAAAVSLSRLPAIVVDFGTAVTFDVINTSGCYLGGVIAPGLPTAAAALHERTALLPLARIRKTSSSVGKSTGEAIRIGILLGAVGMVREVISCITRDNFKGKSPTVIATGGDANLIASLAIENGGGKIFDLVDPLLTLRGLLVIAVNSRLYKRTIAKTKVNGGGR